MSGLVYERVVGAVCAMFAYVVYVRESAPWLIKIEVMVLMRLAPLPAAPCELDAGAKLAPRLSNSRVRFRVREGVNLLNERTEKYTEVGKHDQKRAE